MEKKYKHYFHNSGRKTGLEVWLEDLETKLPTYSKKEQKAFLKLKEQFIKENIYNKENGILTMGDIEVLIDECKSAKFIIDENGNKTEYTEEQRRKEVDDLEDIAENMLKKSYGFPINYIRTYPK